MISMNTQLSIKRLQAEGKTPFLIKGYIFRPMAAQRLTRSLKFDAAVDAIDKDSAVAAFRSLQSSPNYRIQSVTRARVTAKNFDAVYGLKKR